QNTPWQSFIILRQINIFTKKRHGGFVVIIVFFAVFFYPQIRGLRYVPIKISLIIKKTYPNKYFLFCHCHKKKSPYCIQPQ
ncbi:hypothetical protein M23134_06050, partial [Microscilla marina ATCC 23134]